ncbi:carboxypeptidase-like regulatory domain-containing protein [Pedobacter sp.]|uniref:carboxypeptidase-like regulatory domain-containing protein n=1 Tax=Pedobacter sp. TaxID=1411316 RepID=UPI0031DE44AC
MKKLACSVVFALVAIFVFVPVLMAQVGVSIRILPPYPHRITDYEARPQQVLITLTNQSAGTQQIQLRASVVGDNGIRLEVGRNYKSPTPITLAPGQVRNLNGADLVTLFDYNQLTYTGMTKDQFIRGNGLPEGTYQVCMQAFDYTTNTPLSADEPIGCSNRFSITSLEPPLIIKPMEGDELKSTVGNIFAINWTTPPGAPPSVRYKIRIIEVLGNRNPNDAYLSAVAPYFFEKEVMGNAYVYSPADPQLTPGRKYVLAVQALDPSGGFTFRNNGISQVISFSYLSQTAANKETPTTKEEVRPKKPMTTNSIKGKALWAFRASEQNYRGAIGVGGISVAGAGSILANSVNNNSFGTVAQMPASFPTGGLAVQTLNIGGNSPGTGQPAPSSSGSNRPATGQVIGGLVYNAFNPLTDNPQNLQNAMSIDRTLVAAVGSNAYVNSVTGGMLQNNPLSSYIFVTGQKALDFGYEVSMSTPADKKPFAGATVKIIGVPSEVQMTLNGFNTNLNKEKDKQEKDEVAWLGAFTPSSGNNVKPSKATSTQPTTPSTGVKGTNATGNAIQVQNNTLPNFSPTTLEPNLIASGRTDSEGNFAIDFTHPDYLGGKRFSQVKVVISKGVLEQTKIIPIAQLENPDVDLGEIICLAQTYRYSPKVELPNIDGTANDNKKVVVKIYREEADAVAYPFLDEDGNLSPEKKLKERINGKNMVLVAADSTTAKSAAQFKFGKLFHQVNYTVQISSGTNTNKISGGLRVAEVALSSTNVVHVKPTYSLVAAPPSVSGSVQLVLKNGFAGVKGAVVKVEFNQDDVEQQIVMIGTMQSTLGTSYQMTLVNGISMANNTVQQVNSSAQQGNSLVSSTASSYYASSVTSSVLGGGQLGSNFQTGISVPPVTQYINGPYSATTDSAGYYTIPNLPKLKEGKTFTVRLLRLPNEFKNLQVTPGNEMVINRIMYGEQKDVSFKIKPELVQIVGRVVSENKQPINNARLNFAGSTDFFTTGQNGLFTATYFAGKHRLLIKKEGYADADIQVVVPEKNSGSGNAGTAQLPGNILQGQHLVQVVNVFEDTRGREVKNTQANSLDLTLQLINTPTVKNALSNTNTFSPLMFGVASSQSNQKINALGLSNFTAQTGPNISNITNGSGQMVNYSSASFTSSSKITDHAALNAAAEIYNDVLTGSNYGVNSLNSIDLGDVGFLKKKQGKIRFKIIDETTNNPIANATIKLFDTLAKTDNKGEWFYVGFGGDAKVTVVPPVGSGYVTTEESLLINETGDEQPRTIKLQKGISVSGFVRSNGTAVPSVNIKVEEKPYLTTTTDATGAYIFFIPKGNFQLKASKSGYVSKTAAANAVNQPIQLDFEMGDGGGKNISTILGFDVELDKMTAEGNGYRISGAFVNLKPSFADLKTSQEIQLKFSDVKVSFNAQGNAIPEGNKIATDELGLNFKLMNFIPVTLKASNSLVVEADGAGGKITGELMANMSQIQGNRGWSMQNDLVKLVPENLPSSIITAFSSNGSSTAVTKYQIKGLQESWQGKVYGFKFIANNAQSYIDKEGLHFAGNLQTPDLGPIKAATFKIEEFLVGTDLSIRRVNMAQTNLPAIKIADWNANIASLLFNEDGFKIGGNLVIKVPASGTSTIDFSNLSISNDAFFGGRFSIPDNGINVFNIVNLKRGNSAISFGQVPNQSSVYKLGGSAKIKFSKFITSEINIPVFEVHTNGRFLVDAPTNFTADLTFAKLKVQAIKFDNTGSMPFIGIQGAFSVDVPMLSLSVADISFKNNGGGVSVSVGKIKASLDIPVIKTEVEVEMKDNGFAGAGKLLIPGTPVNAAIDFHYFKVNGGIDFGAKFSAGVVIPIGFVTIERVGGGFQYNTATKDFMVDINGALSIANLGAIVKLDPIGLTVRSGPVIEGYGSVVVGTALNLANASIKLDIPQQVFTIAVDVQVEPIKGLASAKLQGDLVVSVKNDDRFVFLGCGIEANLFKLIQSNGEFALAVGLKNPANRGDRISYYFRNVDSRYVRDVFSGVYINTTAKMGIPEDRAIGFDFLIASAHLWYYTEANAKLVLNFAENNYLLGLSGRFGGGFDFCVAKIACAGFGYKACYEFMGGRNETDGWFVGGRAAGSVSLKVGGCNPDCNDWTIKPFCAGFKLCASGGASISYKQNSGLSLGVFVGGTPLCN